MNQMDTNPPIPKRAMIVYAHPDDPDFSVGGTAAVWSLAGAEVIYVLITSGNSGSHVEGMTKERLAAIREDEQRAAARECGVNEVVFLRYEDGALQPTLELRKELVRVMRQYRPDVVVCGDPTAFFYGNFYINHPDHRAAAVATLEAVFPAVSMPLAFPDLAAEGFEAHRVREVWITDSSMTDTLVDIGATLSHKIAALRQHKSQMEDWDPTDMVTSWAKEAGEKGGVALAEAFRRMILVRDDSDQPVTPAVGTPADGQGADEAPAPGRLMTSYGEVNLAHCAPMLREEIALLGQADPFESQRQAVTRLRAILAGLDDAALRWRPAPTEWSINEVLAHLVQTEIVYGYRYRAIVANPRAPIAGFDQDAWVRELPEADQSAEQLLAALAALKQINVALLQKLNLEQRARWGQHSERGPESVAALIGAIAGHDLIHQAQIQENIRLWQAQG